MQGRLFERDEREGVRLPLTEEDRQCAVALSILSAPSGNRIWGMVSSFMPAELFRRVGRSGVTTATQQYLVETYGARPIDAAVRIVEAAGRKKIRILTYWDADYPPLLREIQMPPLTLYVKGEMRVRRTVAVVGTRKSDARSAVNARRIARDMAARGYTIVSGMAVGIDREAHLGALDARGCTIGVLANGIDIRYPRQNRDLYRLIEGSTGSALISEYPPGVFAGKWTFVRRNRIISGLCPGTVVVKAGERSGALITARHALEQNREVFACAGNSFDDEYAGCNRLIRNGAVLVASSDDIMEEISEWLEGDCAMPVPAPVDPENAATGSHRDEEPSPGTLEGKILGLIGPREYSIDAIVRALGESPGDVNEAIVSLELDGRIMRTGNAISRL
ncbi:MAG: DNA-processing protein DprA [Spirochaetes bacterium]|nr:DNA-processing protein DprA [Spirochaetota bacterium]